MIDEGFENRLRQALHADAERAPLSPAVLPQIATASPAEAAGTAASMGWTRCGSAYRGGRGRCCCCARDVRSVAGGGGDRGDAFIPPVRRS